MDSGKACDLVLRELLEAERIRKSSLASVTDAQGVYVLWFAGPPATCLKVGIAGPRRGTGVRGRLRLHYASNPSNSVLARHLAADSASRWSVGRDFTVRGQRQAFLADECYFQALAVENLSRRDLEGLESSLIERLRPTYAGRVRSQSAP